MKKAYSFQILILLAGVLVAFTAVYLDFARFYKAEGTIFKIQNCTYPNPVTTPCFYGAFVFLGALVWSFFIFKKEEPNAKIRQENYLSWLLLSGTLFALGNFTKLFLGYMGGSKTGCSGAPMTSPFFTPCFYGLTIFFVALLVSWSILWKEGEKESNTLHF